MITYSFYTDTYKGSTIPSSSFDLYIRKAEMYVEKCLRYYTIYNTEEEINEVKNLCICEIADYFYTYDNSIGVGIKQESDGQASVTYESSNGSNNGISKLDCIFSTYFDYFRGV